MRLLLLGHGHRRTLTLKARACWIARSFLPLLLLRLPCPVLCNFCPICALMACKHSMRSAGACEQLAAITLCMSSTTRYVARRAMAVLCLPSSIPPLQRRACAVSWSCPDLWWHTRGVSPLGVATSHPKTIPVFAKPNACSRLALLLSERASSSSNSSPASSSSSVCPPANSSSDAAMSTTFWRTQRCVAACLPSHPLVAGLCSF